MIKDAELYKSSIPSQYGGRIASVLNITSKGGEQGKVYRFCRYRACDQ